MTLILLLILFQIKHFLCDYPLQSNYMLGKTKDKGWILPLTCHAGVHSLFTVIIVTIFGGIWFGILMGLFDFVIHFVIDRIKAKASKGIQTDDPKFWRYLGLDQMSHHLTHYTIILIIGVKNAFV